MALFHDGQIFDGRTDGFFGRMDFWSDCGKEKVVNGLSKKRVLTGCFGQVCWQFFGKFWHFVANLGEIFGELEVFPSSLADFFLCVHG